MKIKSIRTYSRSIPLTKPYTIAYNTYYSVELCFLEVELQNGICGYGSASPAEEVTGESINQTKQNLPHVFHERETWLDRGVDVATGYVHRIRNQVAGQCQTH